VATRRAQYLAKQLDDQWFIMGTNKDPIFSRYLATANPSQTQDAVTLVTGEPQVFLTEASMAYRELKGAKKSKTFHASVERAVNYLVESRGDKLVTDYSRIDANAFRDTLVGRELAGSSVARILGTIRAILNFTFSEHAISADNPFEKVQFDREIGTHVRATIPNPQIRKVQSLCYEQDDEARWLIGLISDTGLRLAEGAGLLRSDLKIKHEIPHLVIQPHPWRPLKTKSSARLLPLVGSSIWAAKRIAQQNNRSKFAFPKYNQNHNCTATNSASATLNKWLKARTNDEYTMHGFRHALRDRLRAVAKCSYHAGDQSASMSSTPCS